MDDFATYILEEKEKKYESNLRKKDGHDTDLR